MKKLRSVRVWHNADGQRSGITPESLKNAAAASKQMNLEEAYKILGTDSNAGIEEVMKVKAICFPSCFHVCHPATCCKAPSDTDTGAAAAVWASHAAK